MWDPVTAVPFPLSIFGASFSSPKRNYKFPWLGAPSVRLATFFWVCLKLWEMFRNSCRSDGFVARDKMRWSGELCHPVRNSVRT